MLFVFPGRSGTAGTSRIRGLGTGLRSGVSQGRWYPTRAHPSASGNPLRPKWRSRIRRRGAQGASARSAVGLVVVARLQNPITSRRIRSLCARPRCGSRRASRRAGTRWSSTRRSRECEAVRDLILARTARHRKRAAQRLWPVHRVNLLGRHACGRSRVLCRRQTLLRSRLSIRLSISVTPGR